MPSPLTIALVHTRFASAASFARPLASGTRVSLAREPDNPFDRHAIGVWVARQDLGASTAPDNAPAWRLGMIPAYTAGGQFGKRLAALMDRGVQVEAKIQQHRGQTVLIEVFSPQGHDLRASPEGAQQ